MYSYFSICQKVVKIMPILNFGLSLFVRAISPNLFIGIQPNVTERNHI